MGPIVYILSTLTTGLCATLLLRGFWRSKQRLLLWSGICFLCLAVSNFLLFVDLVLLPDVDLYKGRILAGAVATSILLYGLIWESE